MSKPDRRIWAYLRKLTGRKEFQLKSAEEILADQSNKLRQAEEGFSIERHGFIQQIVSRDKRIAELVNERNNILESALVLSAVIQQSRGVWLKTVSGVADAVEYIELFRSFPKGERE